MRRLVCFLAVGFALSARAVIVSTGDGTSNQTSSGAGSGWNYVGSVNGASGVYLGNYNGSYWVLTAGHVGGHPFTLDGVTYQPVGSDITLTNSDGSSADLKLFRVEGDAGLDALANLSLSSSTPSSRSTLTLIGYGIPRASTTTSWDFNWEEVSSGGIYTGYKWTGSGVKSWGTNSLTGTTTVTYSNGVNTSAFYTSFRSFSTTAQATTGDSGGGVFTSGGALAGIMIAVDPLTGQPDSTSILNQQHTYIVNISAYRSEILSYLSASPVPEPASLALAGLGAVAIFARVRLRRARAGLR